MEKKKFLGISNFSLSRSWIDATGYRITTSLRTSPQAGVAIPINFRQESADLKGIPTPVCALARNDSLLITAR